MSKILVSALDWGLGHTTRIIPIINELLNNGNEVIIGASQKQKIIYREFFPKIKIIKLPSATPVYSKKSSQLVSLVLFLPKFLYSSIKEHFTLKLIINKYSIEQVISDNRYGLYNRSIHSVFISHQLNINLPSGIKFLQAIVNRLNCYIINNFNECWIPDFANNNNNNSLSGKLSTPKYKLSSFIVYKGLLSRFSMVESEEIPHTPQLLVIISGPEKQRSVFENVILNAIGKYNKPIDYLIIRGLPLEKDCPLPHAINHCSSGKLKSYIQNSKYIICRSGYSSIMDLAYLKRTAMLVPTPGQTEQEYLAEFLSEKKRFISVNQKDFDIGSSIQLLEDLNY